MIGLSLLRLTAIGVFILAPLSAAMSADMPTQRLLADSLAEAGDLDSAHAILQKLASNCGSANDTACASILFDLGTLRFNARRMVGADSAWMQALAIYEKELPGYHTSVLDCVRWLATTALIRGDYAAAELLLDRIEADWDGGEQPDPDYPVRAAILLGVIYMNQMRVDDAEAAYRRALDLIERHSNSVTPRLAALLRNNLANLYRHQGWHDEAEPLLLAQVEALEADPSEAGEMLMAAYHNLGELYSDRGEFDRAENYFNRALERNLKVHGQADATVAFNLTSLGNVYMRADRFVDAAACYEEALGIKRASTGLADRSVANTLVMYSHCRRALGDYDEAITLAAESFDLRYRSFVANSWALPEDKALTYAGIMRRSVDACLSALIDHGMPSDSQVSRVADIILQSKGQVSEAVFERQRYLIGADDSLTAELLEGYSSTARRIAQAYLDGSRSDDPGMHQRLLDSLQSAAAGFEQQLARANPRFADVLKMRHVSWLQLQRVLPDEAVLIEYYRYEYRNEHEDTTEDRYAALLVPATDRPVLRDLGPAVVIDSALAQVRRATADMVTRWPELPVESRSLERTARRRLSGLLLRSIEDFLRDGRLLLISPDADLNLLSYGALESGEGRYLIEENPVHYLSAGRDLLRLSAPEAPGTGLLAVGDVDYDVVPFGDPAAGSDNQETDDRGVSATLRSAGALRGELSLLPYTRREVQQVSDQWRRSYDDEIVLCLGRAATEAAFCRYAPGRRAIHVATHGYFEAGPADSIGSSVADLNPLLRSGLWFAGANSSLDGSDASDDGCLTAWEVLTLDLRGVERVVLSACESGLGQVRAGEGVYGLRRAFQMAGARTVVSSLWSVSDKATSRFMTALYSRAESDLPRRLQQVCRAELGSLRQAGLPDDPVAWAAFIATGDWRAGR